MARVKVTITEALDRIAELEEENEQLTADLEEAHSTLDSIGELISTDSEESEEE